MNNQKELNFYICEHCGNIVVKVDDKKVPLVCCGQKMTRLEPGVVEASHEKHIPVVTVEGDAVRVDVGSVAHPMSEEHSIEWVWLHTDRGGQVKYLQPGEAPQAVFALAGEKPIAVYAYCNLHGHWKSEL